MGIQSAKGYDFRSYEVTDTYLIPLYSIKQNKPNSGIFLKSNAFFWTGLWYNEPIVIY